MKKVFKHKMHNRSKKAETMNPELFMTQYMTPMYMSTTNMVVPIANITTDMLRDITNNVVEFATFAWETIGVCVYTFAFIAKEALVALNNNLSFTEKVLIAVCFYNFISQIMTDIESIKLQEKLETTEKQMNHIIKSNRTGNIWEKTWAQEIINIDIKNANKVKDIEKEMTRYKEALDEQTNLINEHQRNDQIIFQKMAQLSKEIRKMKKEMEKYV